MGYRNRPLNRTLKPVLADDDPHILPQILNAEAERLVQGLFLTREHRNDPFPLYRSLRGLAPAHRSEMMGGTWVLSGLAEVKAALLSRGAEVRILDRLPSDWRENANHRNMAEYMVLQDEPAHSALRSKVAAARMRGAIERYRPTLRAIAGGLVDQFVARGGGNVLTDVAYKCRYTRSAP